MTALITVGAALFALSLSGLVAFFVLYPAAVWLVSRFLRRGVPEASSALPTVTLLVVARDSEEFIGNKARNALALDYPEDKLDILFYSDGSTDGTERIVRSFEGPRFRLMCGIGHQGKIPSLNRAMQSCTGEIVALSDADAMLDPDALIKLVRYFADPRVGGVCGQRIIAQEADSKEAQSSYIGLDSAIKLWESRIGSITSNDGKLYAIRRELFDPIAPAVTDDLYVALNVIRQHYRFTFEPEARAYIHTPSRNPAHEVERRRRIVSQGLRSLYLMRATLNPFRHGLYAIALGTNKVLRRMLPFCLILMFLSSVALSFRYPWFAAVWTMHIAFVLLAWSHPLFGRGGSKSLLRRVSGYAHYFALGQYGMMLGTIDFLTGRQVTKWNPVKTDPKAC